MDNSFIVNEIFVSIQGEGRNVGKHRLFIRLHGCNMNCKFCDSKQTWEGHPDATVPEVISIEDMADIINSNGRDVVWTGGEPAIQEKQIQEVRKLVDWKINFDMETNGSIMLEDPEYFNLIVVSPKFDTEFSISDILSKYSRVNAKYGNVIFKFSTDDPEQVKDVTKICSLDPDLVYAMPITSEGNEDYIFQKEFALKCLESGVNFSPRLHKMFGIL